MKTLIYDYSIILHVAAGILSLIFGLIAMTTRKKGGKLHNRSGLIFYWSMALIFVTTVLFVILYPTEMKYHFFLTIGIVSFYPTFTGKRLLKMKKKMEPKWFDLIATYTMLISGIVMIAYGIYLQMNQPEAMAILFLVFGPFSAIQAWGDLRIHLGKKEIEKMHWFLGHAGKMIGAYSAAVTAFCVNIVPRYMPEGSPMLAYIIVWVLPGVLFGIVSAYTIKKYRRKFNGQKPSLKSKVALA
ncbi:hypothetical protein [Jiulongibacter sediminis]|jgi:hypothetical protein|uniref:hypothetical protein n=1 Tax=Jiulongibacter sediminis TaxID=1605367 RepID=UPI0026EE0E74|nr:hypothetical protein [Jiulongibacter sediminis]